MNTAVNMIVDELRDEIWWYCEDLSTSMKLVTDVAQNILNSVFEGAKSGCHWGRHNSKKQDGRQSH